MIWTETPINNDALRQFAEEHGGYWNEAVGDEAVIERGDARVFLSTASAADEDNVMPDDREFATSRLGRIPTSMVSIRIGHAPGSVPLAEETAVRAIAVWGGFLDQNEP
jgi:hypothetical protein